MINVHLLFCEHFHIFGSVELWHYNVYTTFGVFYILYSLTPFILFIQTWQTDSWHIEDMHFLFCAV